MKKFEQAGGYIPPKVETLDLNVELGFAQTVETVSGSSPMNFTDGGDV